MRTANPDAGEREHPISTPSFIVVSCDTQGYYRNTRASKDNGNAFFCYGPPREWHKGVKTEDTRLIKSKRARGGRKDRRDRETIFPHFCSLLLFLTSWWKETSKLQMLPPCSNLYLPHSLLLCGFFLNRLLLIHLTRSSRLYFDWRAPASSTNYYLRKKSSYGRRKRWFYKFMKR